MGFSLNMQCSEKLLANGQIKTEELCIVWVNKVCMRRRNVYVTLGGRNVSCPPLCHSLSVFIEADYPGNVFLNRAYQQSSVNTGNIKHKNPV